MESEVDCVDQGHVISCLFLDEDLHNVLVATDSMINRGFLHVQKAYQDPDGQDSEASIRVDRRHRLAGQEFDVLLPF